MTKDVVKQRNTLQTLVIAAVVIVVGGLLLVLGNLGNDWWNHLFSQFGSAVIVAAGLGMLWEWSGKRLLAEEVAGNIEAARAVTNWGIRDLSLEWHEQPWSELFKKGSNVDLMLSYGQTWRNTTQSGLQGFLSDSTNTLRVCLPDPKEEWLMEALGHRFSQPAAQIRSKIYEAAAYFARLRDNGAANVELYFRAGEPVYALYRFESAAIVTLYAHRQERSSRIPTLKMESGEFVDWLRGDFEAAIRDARKVSDEEIFPAEQH